MNELEALAKEWERRARVKFADADLETQKPRADQLRHVATAYCNAAFELREAIAKLRRETQSP